MGECGMSESTNQTAELPATATEPELDVVEDVLVEEVSIDGMCGVY